MKFSRPYLIEWLLCRLIFLECMKFPRLLSLLKFLEFLEFLEFLKFPKFLEFLKFPKFLKYHQLIFQITHLTAVSLPRIMAEMRMMWCL